MLIPAGRALQAERTSSAKAFRQEQDTVFQELQGGQCGKRRMGENYRR